MVHLFILTYCINIQHIRFHHSRRRCRIPMLVAGPRQLKLNRHPPAATSGPLVSITNDLGHEAINSSPTVRPEPRTDTAPRSLFVALAWRIANRGKPPTTVSGVPDHELARGQHLEPGQPLGDLGADNPRNRTNATGLALSQAPRTALLEYLKPCGTGQSRCSQW